MRKTLIVIDMQNDFITGPLGTEEARAIVPNVQKKIDEYSERHDLIIFTRDTHRPNYLNTHEGKYLPVTHCIEESRGHDIYDELRLPWMEDMFFANKSPFERLSWPNRECMNNIEIIGVCTDICVVSNALILRSQFPESEITVDASCCAGTTPENHKAALAVMKSCHINIIGEE